MGQFRAGASEVCITPRVGVDLSGFGSREGPSEGVHDDLFCRVVVLDGGEERLVLAGLDLLRVGPKLEAAMCEAVAAAADARPEAVLLNCSHTHAGPDTGGLEALGRADEEYVAWLPGKAASASAAAVEALASATLRYGEAPLAVGVHRREIGEDGVVRFGRNLEGVSDRVVRVVSVEGSASGTEAVLFHYACHGTALKGDNRLISAEWMGAAASLLRQDLGGRSLPVFLQGCSGQINADVEANTFDEMNRVGQETAEAVKRALDEARPMEATPLAARLTRVELPVQRPLERGEAEALLEQRRRDVADARQRGLHPYIMRGLDRLVAHAEAMLARPDREGPASAEGLPFVVQALRIGELGVAALSGEVFFEFSQAIQAQSPFAHTWVLGYTNGCTCYVPTKEAFAQGGYEAEDSFAWYGVAPLAPEAGDKMTEVAVKMLGEVHGGDGDG